MVNVISFNASIYSFDLDNERRSTVRFVNDGVFDIGFLTLIYNLLATIYLLYLGVGGKLVGTLLWPAVALHAILTILLTRVWRLVGGK